MKSLSKFYVQPTDEFEATNLTLSSEIPAELIMFRTVLFPEPWLPRTRIVFVVVYDIVYFKK